MPSNLKDVTFPKGQQLSRVTLSSFIKSSSTTEDPSGAPSPAARRRAKGTSGVVDFNDDSLPATQRVTALCSQLSTATPRYVITRSTPGVDRYYDGYPDFGHENGIMPEGLGHVRRVEGHEKARLAVASLVLEHLICEYRERQSLLEDMSMPLEGAPL